MNLCSHLRRYNGFMPSLYYLFSPQEWIIMVLSIKAEEKKVQASLPAWSILIETYTECAMSLSSLRGFGQRMCVLAT